jgi:ribosomal protein L12E/L44/L45/RPP1/RPP2
MKAATRNVRGHICASRHLHGAGKNKLSKVIALVYSLYQGTIESALNLYRRTESLCLAHATATLRASCPEEEEEEAAAAAAEEEEEEEEEAEEEEIFCVVCPWSWVRAGAPNVARPEHPGVVHRCLAPYGYIHIYIRTQAHRKKEKNAP